MKTKLIDLRESRNLTKTELAKVLNMSSANYGRIENGLQTLSLEQAVLLADFFGVSLDYLANRKIENISIEKSKYIKICFHIDELSKLKK